MQTLKNAIAIFANFEKRHSRLQKMPLEMAWNEIFQSLEIAVAFLGGIYRINQKKITGRAAASLVSAARSVILSFIDYIDNGVEPSCQIVAPWLRATGLPCIASPEI